jgi:hypothetical protein
MGTACFTGLKITHLIPERRTTRQYMSRLIAGKVESAVVLASLYKYDKDNLTLQRFRVLKLKYLFFWVRYLVSGFSVHSGLALSSIRGRLNGYKRLRELGLLGSHAVDKVQLGFRKPFQGTNA